MPPLAKPRAAYRAARYRRASSVKNIGGFSSAPFLYMIPKYTPGDIDSGLEAGADGYVSKLGLNELFQKVQSLLDGEKAA